MAEFGENEIEETLDEDYSEIAETPEVSEDEVTYDDYLALKNDNQALKERLKKAESKIVEEKKRKKEAPKTIDTEMRLFLVENPDAKDYKDKILELKAVPKYKDLDLEDLLDLAKIKTPPVSKTKTDYDFKS
jgi:regulator of replication initiation timing